MAIGLSNPRRASDDHNQAFESLAEPFRREIKLHCYRMLGSLYEAEDLVQETYLRAWRSFATFDGRSIRAWLYKIATNTCLNVLESRKHQHRYLPDELGPPSPPELERGPALDVPWLEPYPDSNIEGVADNALTPDTRYTLRESVQLAFVAAIQQLPPRQRAALMLCDVLGWSSAGAASLLGGSTASINSALQRARETLAKRYPDHRSPLDSQPTPSQRDLLNRYLQAWEGRDLEGFVALLKEDATVTMPPSLEWFVGHDAIRSVWRRCGHRLRDFRLLPTAANGQPAFAVYEFSVDESHFVALAIHVLTLVDNSISAITVFLEPRLFHAFGLPQILPPHERRNSTLTPQGVSSETRSPAWVRLFYAAVPSAQCKPTTVVPTVMPEICLRNPLRRMAISWICHIGSSWRSCRTRRRRPQEPLRENRARVSIRSSALTPLASVSEILTLTTPFVLSSSPKQNLFCA